MSTFDFIAQEAIASTATARYAIIGLRINGGVPFLLMRPATEENQDYHRASIRQDLARTRRIEALTKGMRRQPLSDDEAINRSLDAYEHERERDAELFPEHVIVGWGIHYRSAGDIVHRWPRLKEPKDDKAFDGPMVDSKGKPVDLTPETARDFVKAVWRRSPDDWDRIRAFAKNTANYREVMSDEEVDELAKNSPSGSSGK